MWSHSHARSKGAMALLFSIRALAVHEHVDQALLDEWQLSRPQLIADCNKQAASMAPKVAHEHPDQRLAVQHH